MFFVLLFNLINIVAQHPNLTHLYIIVIIAKKNLMHVSISKHIF